MKTLFSIFCFISSHVAFGQKEANFWYFGRNLGLNFNVEPPEILTDGMIKEDYLIDCESAATISDHQGNLLFYTDGVHVYNRKNELMPNGEGLWGSSTTTQTLIVPQPESDSIFYIFTASPQAEDDFFPAEKRGFRYSIVNMSLDGGNGDVVSKNSMLVATTTERIAGTKHANGNDVWVVMHEWRNNRFNSFRVTNKGIIQTPIASETGAIQTGVDAPAGNGESQQFAGNNAIGQMKISPDGSKLALNRFQDKTVEIFTFDNSSGRITSLTAPFSIDLGTRLYGLEFSPSSRFLYLSTFAKNIFQIDLSEKDVRQHIEILGKDSLFYDSPAQMQLAPDGKIYIAKFEWLFLGVIEQPDLKGDSCRYITTGLFFTPDGKHFVQQSLPNFISSYFYDSARYPSAPILEMPNVFTPNNDRFNELFRPISMYHVKSLKLKIVNRWGEQIFASRNGDSWWSGQGSDSGIYYWTADFEGTDRRSYFRKGFVQVFK